MSTSTPFLDDINLAGTIGPKLVDALNAQADRDGMRHNRKPGTWTGKVSEYGAHMYTMREANTGVVLTVSSQRGSNCAKEGSIQVRAVRPNGGADRINMSSGKAADDMVREVMRRLYPEALRSCAIIRDEKATEARYLDNRHALLTELAQAAGESAPTRDAEGFPIKRGRVYAHGRA